MILVSELQVATSGDVLLQKVLHYLSEGWRAKSAMTSELKQCYDVHEMLSSIDENLLYKDSVVVILTVLWSRVLELAHKRHPGIVKMKQHCHTTV